MHVRNFVQRYSIMYNTLPKSLTLGFLDQVLTILVNEMLSGVSIGKGWMVILFLMTLHDIDILLRLHLLFHINIKRDAAKWMQDDVMAR